VQRSDELVTRSDASPTGISPSLSRTGRCTPSKFCLFFTFVFSCFIVSCQLFLSFSAFYHIIPGAFIVFLDSFIVFMLFGI
jgi:hypothetical protein